MNPCLSSTYATLTGTENQGSFTDTYSGTAQTFTHSDFTVAPGICPLTITCDSISGPSSGVLLCENYELVEQLDGSLTTSLVFTETDFSDNGLAPGTYTFTYDVTTGSSDAPLTKQFFFTVTLVDPCLSATFTNTPVFADQELTLTDSATSYAYPSSVTFTPTYCVKQVELTTADNPAIGPFLTLDDANEKIDVAQIINSLALLNGDQNASQVYNVDLTFTIESPYAPGVAVASATVVDDFDITVKNPCIDPNFVFVTGPDTLEDVTYIIDDVKKTFTAHGAFGISTQPDSHTLCGTDLTLTPKFNSAALTGDPMTYDDAALQFSAESSTGSFIGQTLPYSVTAELANYPASTGASSKTAAGTIEFIDPCIDPFTFAPTAQTSPGSDNFSGTDIVFTLTDFTITPARCLLSYACTAVSESGEATSSIACGDFEGGAAIGADGELVFSASGADYGAPYRPGTYTVTVTATVLGVTSPETRDATFNLVLTDPCDAPVSISLDTPADQDYTLTTTALVITDPHTVTIDPDYCPFTLEYSVTNLSDGSSAITESPDGTFTVFWDSSRFPAGKTQTVTAVVTSRSDYGSDSTPKTATDSFDVNYLDPCIDPNVAIVSPTTQPTLPDDAYTGNTITFTHNPYTVTPSFCPLTLTCEGVSGPSVFVTCGTIDNNVSMDKSYTTTDYIGTDQVYGDDMAPGTYTFTFKVSTGGTDPSLNPTFTVDQTLIDPCVTATLTVPQSGTLTYTITQAGETESLDPLWATTPDYCLFNLSADFE